MTKNQIEYFKLQEQKDYNAKDINLRSLQHEENVRSNKEREKENLRSNQARENETHRSNVANENLTKIRDDRRHQVDLGNLNESIRSHKAQEAIGRSQVQVGWAQVGLGYSQLAEAQRSNKVNEGLRSREADIKSVDVYERVRSNQANEQLRADELGLKYDELDFKYVKLTTDTVASLVPWN